jgi:hypothetical protein
MAYAAEWGENINKWIIPFSGRNKVATKNNVTDRQLEDVVKGSSPIVKALLEIDKYPLTGETVAKNFEPYAKAQKILQKEANTYGSTVAKAIKEVDKEEFPDVYRNLKLILKYLEVTAAHIDHDMTTYSKEYTKATDKLGSKLEKTREEMRKKKIDDNEIKAQTAFLSKARLLVSFPTGGKKALTASFFAVQQVRAEPTPAKFNALFNGNGVGRILSQQFLNLALAAADGNCPSKLREQLNGIDSHTAKLREYGDGASKEIAGNASQQDVLDRIKDFDHLVKDLAPYYQKASSYLSKNKL